MTADPKQRLLELTGAHGQSHVLRFWDSLDEAERSSLAAQVESLDFDLIDSLVKNLDSGPQPTGDIAPAPFIELTRRGDDSRWREAAGAGEAAIREGRVAAFVVAGGQGTRLGFDGPKGCFPIGPVTDRSLFRLHAEKVLAASRHYGRAIPFLVMTSSANDEATRRFFEENSFFGLDPDMVRIFRQGELPAVDADGRLILERPGHIFMSPNGHGGSIKALWDSGAVEWLESLGVDVISYFQVDNPLVRIIDPAFVGFQLLEGAEMSLKLLRRTIPDEKLGVWVLADGRPQVIEYIDMPSELMRARDDAGGLLFAGGSIAINLLSVPFVRRLNEKGFALPFHRARKKIPCINDAGETVEPSEPNGTKFETFVFDALAFAQKAIGVETSRAEEFSPVKNASGTDSPETARRDMSRLYAEWLSGAGVEVPVSGDGYSLHLIEVSPLVGEGAAELKAGYGGPWRIEGPTVIA
jgi:UDP-N-acetylglucosamine/UDP-N-acetylgalactosamine diphosphorylase